MVNKHITQSCGKCRVIIVCKKYGVNNGSRCRNVTECGKGHHLIEGCNMRRITCLEMRSEVWLHWEGGNVMYM